MAMLIREIVDMIINVLKYNNGIAEYMGFLDTSYHDCEDWLFLYNRDNDNTAKPGFCFHNTKTGEFHLLVKCDNNCNSWFKTLRGWDRIVNYVITNGLK